MNKIFADRVRLLSAMNNACKEMQSDNYNSKEIDNIKNAILMIRRNTEDFLSISQDDKNSVAYYKDVKKSNLDSKHRVKTTLGRYIRRRLSMSSSEISDQTLDKLSAVVKRTILSKELDKEISILKGRDIVENYRNSKAGSCMTGSECDKVEIYALNPDKVSLVLHGAARALLWKTDEGDFVLDRVYPAQCHSVEILRKWAKSKGYILRKNADRVVDTGYLVELSDKKIKSVTLNHRGVFPYMDTFVYGKFVYGEYSKNTIVAKNDPSFGNMIMHSTYGRYDRAKVCMKCEKRLDNGDYTTASNGDLYCYECFDKFFFCCDYCGEHKIAETDGKHILISSYCLCEKCFNNTLFIKACHHCGQKDYHINLHLTEDDKYFCYECYVEQLVGCVKCRKRFEKDKMVLKDVCKNCFECEVCGVCCKRIDEFQSGVYMEDGLVICNSCGS